MNQKLTTFFKELKTNYPRDFNYASHLFVKFLLVKVVQKMSQADLAQLANIHYSKSTQGWMTVIDKYLTEDEQLYTQTMEEFKTITYA